MNDDILLAANLRLRHGALPQAGALCAALVSQLAAERDVVAVLRPNSRLEFELQRCVAVGRLFQFGRSTSRPAAEDADVAASADLPWPHTHRPAYRLRRLDTLFPDFAHAGLIVTDDPIHAPELLRGAAANLATSAPAIVLDLSVLPIAERFAAWSACDASLDTKLYTWFDGLMLSCPLKPWVVETLADAAVCALPQPAQPPLRRLASLGWVPPLPPASASESPSVTHFDETVPGVGLYPPERSGDLVCRWTGPDPFCHFFVRLPGPGRWQVTLTIADFGCVTSPAELSLFAEDQVLRLLDCHAGALRFGDYRATPLADAGRIEIQLTTPRPRRRAPDDPRPLGIALHRVSLNRVG